MRSLTRIPRLRPPRPASDASLDRVAAHDDPPRARLGPKPARPDQTDRAIGQPGRNRSGILHDYTHFARKFRNSSITRPVLAPEGRVNTPATVQCAPVLVKM